MTLRYPNFWYVCDEHSPRNYQQFRSSPLEKDQRSEAFEEMLSVLDYKMNGDKSTGEGKWLL